MQRAMALIPLTDKEWEGLCTSPVSPRDGLWKCTARTLEKVLQVDVNTRTGAKAGVCVINKHH
jgi:hypothetical protein